MGNLDGIRFEVGKQIVVVDHEEIHVVVIKNVEKENKENVIIDSIKNDKVLVHRVLIAFNVDKQIRDFVLKEDVFVCREDYVNFGYCI